MSLEMYFSDLKSLSGAQELVLMDDSAHGCSPGAPNDRKTRLSPSTSSSSSSSTSTTTSTNAKSSLRRKKTNKTSRGPPKCPFRRPSLETPKNNKGKPALQVMNNTASQRQRDAIVLGMAANAVVVGSNGQDQQLETSPPNSPKFIEECLFQVEAILAIERAEAVSSTNTTTARSRCMLGQ